jgi:hypothetical protein
MRMIGKSNKILCIFACLLGIVAPAVVSAERSNWEWNDVPRVVVLGDVHGSYTKMVRLLVGTGTVDDRLAWTGGNQHLIFCGDLTDRGTDDRAVMDLARRLQEEAAEAGGKVHVVLGNHDVMNLTRDRRYWDADLLDEFTDDESEEERKVGLRQFRLVQKTQGAHEAFDEKFPPGYFARARAFEPDGEYGSWLLQQPTVIKVNGVLFVHGGLTRRVAKLGLDEINRQVTTGIQQFLAAADELGNAVAFPADLREIVFTAEEAGNKAGRAVLKARESLAFDSTGPLWYRGTSIENERLEVDRVDQVLGMLEARAEVMAHTVTRSGQISSRFNGRVYRADVGMSYGQAPLAAVLEAGEFKVYDPATKTLTEPYVEAPQGEGWPAGEEDLPDQEIEKFLQKAKIESISTIELDDVSGQFLSLELKDMKLRAYFGTTHETAEQAAAAGRKARRRYQHHIAAYKLDRRLDLDMVPVNVLRKIKGVEGMVQIFMQNAIDLAQLQEYDDFSVLVGMDTQIAKARAFNAVIGLRSEDRLRQGKMVLPASKRVMLADNGIAFTDEPTVEPFLPEGCGPVGPAFLHELGKLELATIKKDLEKLLSGVQIEAIMKRRDALLAKCAEENPDWSVQKVLDLQPPPPE